MAAHVHIAFLIGVSLPRKLCVPPVVIGGVAGSGTRVVATLAKSLGAQLHGDHNLDCCSCTNPRGNWSNLQGFLAHLDCTRPWAVKCPDFLWRFAGLESAWPGAMLVQVVRDVRDVAFDSLLRRQYAGLAQDYASGVLSPALETLLGGAFEVNGTRVGTRAINLTKLQDSYRSHVWKASVWSALNLWAVKSVSSMVVRLEDSSSSATVQAFRERLMLSHASASSLVAATALESSISHALDSIAQDLGSRDRVTSSAADATREPLNHSWASNSSLCSQLSRIQAVEAAAVTAMSRFGYEALPSGTCG
jgi:hypothetical protein